jgi:hypothetical protein
MDLKIGRMNLGEKRFRLRYSQEDLSNTEADVFSMIGIGSLFRTAKMLKERQLGIGE